jgi:hypothetical protein
VSVIVEGDCVLVNEFDLIFQTEILLGKQIKLSKIFQSLDYVEGGIVVIMLAGKKR